MKKISIILICSFSLFANNFNFHYGPKTLAYNKCEKYNIQDNLFKIEDKCLSTHDKKISSLLCSIKNKNIICIDNKNKKNYMIITKTTKINNMIIFNSNFIELIELLYEEN